MTKLQQILIIDDDDIDRIAIKRALKPKQHEIEITEAIDGKTGIAIAQEMSLDCIFLDYLLPDGDGLSILKEMRSLGIDYPVVMLTGQGDERLAVEIMKAGASDYLTKNTLSPEILSKTLQHVSQIYQAELERERIQQEQTILIEKLKQAQNQLLQSEKMASIGQLAAGVAHEINNPVGFISSNISTLKTYLSDIFSVLDAYKNLEEQSPAGKELDDLQQLKSKIDLDFLKEDIENLVLESQDGLVRVKQIVQDLKDFSHVDEAEWQWADIHHGIDSTLNIVNSEIKYKAEVTKEYGSLPQVECLASQLNQVFMNLMVNAAHAIEERGTITIRTGTEENDKIWIEIQDTGKGITPEHINRIFDPFFTTKPIGQGTGLGLSLSYSIIQKHHGELSVTSALGEGTTFRICLPKQQQVTKLGN